MSDIFFDWVKASWNEEYLICYKRGEICTPIFMLDKQDVLKLKEELKEQPHAENPRFSDTSCPIGLQRKQEGVK